jgi:hypothetical protein
VYEYFFFFFFFFDNMENLSQLVTQEDYLVYEYLAGPSAPALRSALFHNIMFGFSSSLSIRV